MSEAPIRADVCAERQNAIQSEVYAERMVSDGLRKQLDAANRRIAELEAAQRWVSVDERLPDDGVDVMVYVNTPLERNTWDIARRDRLYGWIFFTEWEFGAPTPTHWMPLPPPPVTPDTP